MQKALIVDDSSTVRMIISKMLNEWGIPSVQAENGQVAFEELSRSEGITIAFVDWNMPVMSGIQFLRRVRADARFSHTKMVMVTTETELPQVMSALEAGADEYIMKPFTREIFRDKLAILGVDTKLATSD